MKIPKSADSNHHEIGTLLRRCREGDHVAWKRLVDRFQGLVYSIAKRTGLSTDDCADVFQSTFVALHKNLDRLEEPAALPKWIAVTASRESLRLKRVNSRATTKTSEHQTLDELVADEEDLADQAAIQALESELLHQSVSELAEKCRELLSLLYFADDVSYQEVSEKTGLAMGSIGPTRARCIEKLRTIVARKGFFNESTYQDKAAAPHY